jgi:hypothetical protein
MGITDKQLKELTKLELQLSNSEVINKIPKAALEKIQIRAKELSALKEKPVESIKEQTIYFEEEVITHLIYTLKAKVTDPDEVIRIDYPFPGQDKSTFLGNYNNLKDARKVINLLDSIFYPIPDIEVFLNG